MSTAFARAALVVFFTAAAVVPARGDLIERTGRFGGLDVTYKVVRPPGFDASRSYPVVLVFTGGPQQLRGAENTLNADWRAEAERRGYVVVSPGTPNGRLFFEDADRIFPEFLDMLVREYRPPGGRLHVAGHSNGGLSAYHVAAKFPRYFVTVTGYPGLLDGQPDPGRIQSLKPLCLFMHVGDRDAGWLNAMRRQADSLREQGFRIAFTVEKGQEHRLRSQAITLSPRLFDQIEGCAR